MSRHRRCPLARSYRCIRWNSQPCGQGIPQLSAVSSSRVVRPEPMSGKPIRCGDTTDSPSQRALATLLPDGKSPAYTARSLAAFLATSRPSLRSVRSCRRHRDFQSNHPQATGLRTLPYSLLPQRNRGIARRGRWPWKRVAAAFCYRFATTPPRYSVLAPGRIVASSRMQMGSGGPPIRRWLHAAESLMRLTLGAELLTEGHHFNSLCRVVDAQVAANTTLTPC